MTIFDYRKRDGLTQEELAKKLDVDRAAVCQWERGRAHPMKKHVRRLCNVFGCTAEELTLPEITVRKEIKPNAENPSCPLCQTPARSPERDH